MKWPEKIPREWMVFASQQRKAVQARIDAIPNVPDDLIIDSMKLDLLILGMAIRRGLWDDCENEIAPLPAADVSEAGSVKAASAVMCGDVDLCLVEKDIILEPCSDVSARQPAGELWKKDWTARKKSVPSQFFTLGVEGEQIVVSDLPVPAHRVDWRKVLLCWKWTFLLFLMMCVNFARIRDYAMSNKDPGTQISICGMTLLSFLEMCKRLVPAISLSTRMKSCDREMSLVVKL